jgi:hypothetical protein
MELTVAHAVICASFEQFVGSFETASVVQWSEFLATDPDVPGSIPGVTRFSGE